LNLEYNNALGQEVLNSHLEDILPTEKIGKAQPLKRATYIDGLLVVEEDNEKPKTFLSKIGSLNPLSKINFLNIFKSRPSNEHYSLITMGGMAL
jgi:hypothetical protein